MSRRRSALAVAAAVLFAGTARGALAETPPARILVDRPVVRFYAPETGGAAEPRFVDGRVLAFEARLEAIAENPDGIGAAYDERQLRSALDRHIGEEMLAGLADKLIAGSPPWQRPDEVELRRLALDLGSALFERLGGRARVESAATAEELDPSELDALLSRQALAVWYLNRAITPILDASDEQLREVFRTAAHPYRGQPFESARAAFRGWFLIERVRVAESAFLQGSRSRLRVIVIQ